MGFMDMFGGNKPPENKIVDSHEQVDPKAEIERITSRIRVLEGQDEINSDDQEELRILRAKLGNLNNPIGQ